MQLKKKQKGLSRGIFEPTSGKTRNQHFFVAPTPTKLHTCIQASAHFALEQLVFDSSIYIVKIDYKKWNNPLR